MKKNYILLLTMVLVGLYSCEDFLIKEPTTSSSPDIVLSDVDGFKQGAIGTYAILNSQNYYGANFVLLGDLMGNTAKKSPLQSGRYNDYYFWASQQTTAPALWGTAYYLISNANNLIDAIDEYEALATDDPVEISHLKGHGLFLRALAHFDLVRLYAKPYTDDPSALGVPVVLKTEIALPVRNTVQEVYTQVISDLKEAITLYGAAPVLGGNDAAAWGSVDACNALLARVYLYMGDYTNAATHANEVINSGNYTLYTTANYALSWGANASPEVIFEVYGDLGNSYNPWWEEIGYMTWAEGYADVCATNDLYDSYEAGDVRKDVFHTSSDAAYANSYWWPSKYPGKTDGNRRDNNIVVLRLSEMYLIRAEAALNGAGSTALADINLIRTNRGATALASANMDNLLNERRLELCFEGHNFFDYKRLKKTLVRPNESGTLPSNTLSISYPDFRWALPISDHEIVVNENIVQNEGY